MKTLSITEGRQNLGAWLKRALQGEDVGFLVDGRVVALRPVGVHSEDYVLHEYGARLERCGIKACAALESSGESPALVLPAGSPLKFVSRWVEITNPPRRTTSKHATTGSHPLRNRGVA